MKTKEKTRQRTQETEFKLMSKDIKWEYDVLVDDDILDEVALAEVLDEEE